ncbi:uncharacterized protein [Asterias amurensis]|uniref:uncharacterized protein isoform X1 n=1 Tax=Asterias amurensis TaxID=7602 RepID=UPI003AB7ADD4
MELSNWKRKKSTSTVMDAPTEDSSSNRPQPQELSLPFMRASATVRRESPHLPPDLSSTQPNTNFFDKLQAGTNEQWSSKLGSHLSSNPSSVVDRQVGLLAGNVVSRNPNPGSKEGQLFLKRVRPDLPEPNKLRSKSKKSNKRRPSSHTAWNISEHIAQLKHKCQDFNLGVKTRIDIRGRHKPEETVATVRRKRPMATAHTDIPKRVPPPPQSGLPPGIPSAQWAYPFEDADNESESWRWKPEKIFPNTDDDKIPQYLLPPSKPTLHHQHVPLSETSSSSKSFAGEDVAMVTSNWTVTELSYHQSHWNQFLTSKETDVNVSQLNVSGRLPKEPTQTKFIEE